MRPVAWAYALLLAASSATAQIYKCTDANGQPVFSDRPCAKDAETVTVDIPESTGANLGNQGDFSKVNAANDLRAAEQKIKRIEEYIGRLEAEHDRKISALNRELSGLSYGKIDESSRARIQNQISEADSRYYSQLRSARNSLSDAHRDLGRARAADRMAQ